MRAILFLLSLIVMGGVAQAHPVGAPRPAVQRDVEGYAIAVCLIHQPEPYRKEYLEEQGHAWASAVVHMGKMPVELLPPISEAVKREIAKGGMPSMRPETPTSESKAMPLFYCGGIIDKPDVRAAIRKAIIKFTPYYRSKNSKPYTW